MLIEIYIFLEVLLIFLFVASYKEKNEIFWAATVVTGVITAFASYNVEKMDFVGAVTAFANPHMAWFNTGVALLAGLYFFIDIFDKYYPSFIEKTPLKVLKR